MSLAYLSAIISGSEIKKKQVQKYIARPKEPRRTYQRRSTFGVGLDSQEWINNLEQYQVQVEELMNLTPNKRRFYRQGLRAVTLIQSIT